MKRTEPLWVEKISYELACGRNVLVVAHANTLRGLVKIIDGIGDDEIQDIAIPTGIPIVYKFDQNLTPIPPTADESTVAQVHMNGVFLEKPGLLKQAIKREQEWCANVPDYDIVMSRKSTGMTPLERSLSKLEAQRQVQEWASSFADENEDEDDGTDGKLTLVEQDKIWEKGLDEVEEGEYFDPDHPKFEADKNVAKANGSEEETVEAPIYNASYNPCVSAMPVAATLPGLGPVPIKRKSESLIVMIRHGKTENNKLGLFTGWDDVPLAAEGVDEAKEAGKLLKLHGFEFDVVYTSWLSRAIETAWCVSVKKCVIAQTEFITDCFLLRIVMDEMDCLWLPIIKSWRLNEVSSRAFLLGARQFIFTDHYNVQKFRECTVI
jgi:2,3-bisphosphoglycerate-dependent phosphoglycerate mutase